MFCRTSNNAVNFTGVATGGVAPYTYNWSFGDGGTATGSTPLHTYNSAGPFSVRLIVTDSLGCTDTLLLPNYITTSIPNAAFTVTTGCTGLPLVFLDASSPASTSVSWNFGTAAAPSTSTLSTPMPVFNTAGTYPVTLVSTSNGCSDTVTQNVQIFASPAAVFTSTPPSPCAIPATINYAASGPPGSTYLWKFSGGGTATGANPSRVLSQYGIYTDTLIATAANGCTSYIINPGNVRIYDKWPKMEVSKTEGCIPLVVSFKDSLTTSIGSIDTTLLYPPGVSSWSWNFGDGFTSTQAQPTHTFTDTGKFWVVVTMTTTNGCVVKDSIRIQAGRPPNAAFTNTPATACVKNLIYFNNTTTGAQSYFWSYGDGGSSGGQSPPYMYFTPGSFVVVLNAFHNGCLDTAQRRVTINPPSVSFKPFPDCDTPLLVRFQNTSLGVQTYSWTFGDGNTSNQAQPTHTYNVAGIYNVKLLVSNATSGCIDTLTRQINLLPGAVSITANDTTICRGDSVVFTGNYAGNTAQSWEWTYQSPAGWIPHTSTSNTLTLPYSNAGRWGVKFVVENSNGCRDSVVKNSYILVTQPRAQFIVSDSAGCAPLTVNFTDFSADLSGVPLTSRNWIFGNGQTQTGGTSATAVYPVRGNYDVILAVANGYGCTDTLRKTGFIKSLKPIAGINPSDTVICPGAPVVLNNASGGGLFQNSRWAFGDGDSSSIGSATHTYRDTGVYNVWLVTTDSIGCRDTVLRQGLIRVQKPTASFTASDSQTVCPAPFVVTFQNASQSIISSLWNYGNGRSSTLRNGGTAYTDTGVYTAALVVTDAEGCKDTAQKTIRVLGYSSALHYTPLLGCTPMTVNLTTNLQNIPSVIWDFGDGVTLASTDTAVTHVYQTPGAYIPLLVVADGQGCATSSSGVDTVKADGITARFTTAGACSGQPVLFTDSSQSLFSGTAAQQWIFPGGNTSNATNPAYVLGPSGDYSVQLMATNSNGCKDTIMQTVTVRSIPVISAGKDTAVCPGSAVALGATGGVRYSWSPSAGLNDTTVASPSASPQIATLYTVTGTDSFGCPNSDSVWVRIKFKTTGNAKGDDSVCVGTSIRLQAGGGTSYLWIPATGLEDSSMAAPLARPDSSTRYLVIIRDGTCVPDSHYVEVEIYPAPVVRAGPDKGVVNGESVLLETQISGAVNIRWTPTEGLSCNSCASPQAAPKKNTLYTVTAVSDRGCTNEDDVLVYVDCRDGQLFVPNSFTPNGDGENDVFYVHGAGIDRVRSFRIYNRWGGLVFEARNFQVNDKSAGWDGMQGGEKLPADAFVYVLEATCITGQPLISKGDVTLIR